MTDKFVYCQNDLDTAIAKGCTSIMLCAGIFDIPLCKNTTFKRLGPVKVNVMASRRSAFESNMQFIDIEPQYANDYAITNKASMLPIAAFTSYGSFGSYGSFLKHSFYSSFTSYGSYGSGVAGHYYEYEFEFEYNRSFSGSFLSSFGKGYSFNSSYIVSGSGGSFSELLTGKNNDFNEQNKLHVFGYGINLI